MSETSAPDRSDRFVRAHLDRVYLEVLACVDTIPILRLSTQDLRDAGLTSGELEMAADGRCAFWNPDGGTYLTRTEWATPDERRGMAEVVYLGGIARFWLPASWRAEMNAENIGEFSDPDGGSVLRLSVLTVETSGASAPTQLRHTLKPSEWAIDGGRLTSGHEFDVYEADGMEGGTRLRYWQIIQVLPRQCRI